MIKLIINGKETEVPPNSNVDEMLTYINHAGKMFVVEKNLEIIPKDQYSSCILQDGDCIEIVGFAGGG